MKTCIVVAVAVVILAVAGITSMSGCGSPTAPKPDSVQIAAMIKQGTSVAVSMGMVAVPNDAEALQACKEALSTIDQNVLPILKGDEAGLVNGLQKILALEAFNEPKLLKVKLVIEMALPLLQMYITSNLTTPVVGKINPEVKSYIVAFFEGAREGLSGYIGEGQRGSPYQDLRKRLAK